MDTENLLREKIAKLQLDMDIGIVDCPTAIKHKGMKAVADWKADQILVPIKEAGYVKLAGEQIFPEMADFGTTENQTQKDYAEKMYDEGWRKVDWR